MSFLDLNFDSFYSSFVTTALRASEVVYDKIGKGGELIIIDLTCVLLKDPVIVGCMQRQEFKTKYYSSLRF